MRCNSNPAGRNKTTHDCSAKCRSLRAISVAQSGWVCDKIGDRLSRILLAVMSFNASIFPWAKSWSLLRPLDRIILAILMYSLSNCSDHYNVQTARVKKKFPLLILHVNTKTFLAD